MKNNEEVLKQAKVAIAKQNNSKFISQEAMIRLVRDRVPGATDNGIALVFKAIQDITVERFKAGQDSLIPGIMRIVPGDGGLTRRYVKIQSVSETLKSRLK